MIDVVIDALDRVIWKESLIASLPAELYTKRQQRFVSVFDSFAEHCRVPIQQVFMQPRGPSIGIATGGYVMPWMYESVAGGRFYLHSCEKPCRSEEAMSSYSDKHLSALVHRFSLDLDKLINESKEFRWVLLKGMDESIAHASVGINPLPAVFSSRFTLAMVPHGQPVQFKNNIIIADVLPILVGVAEQQKGILTTGNQAGNEGFCFA